MLYTNPVSVDEFRTNLSEFIGRVVYGQDRIVIKKYNREAAVLLSVEEYERLIDPTKRFSKEEWQEKFQRLDKIRDRIPRKDQKQLEVDIDRAVREVRTKKKRYGQKA